MSITNLSAVFGPLVMRAKSVTLSKEQQDIVHDIAKMMVQEYEDIFGTGTHRYSQLILIYCFG